MLRDILSAWIDDIAVSMINLVRIFNSETVIIGGGVSRQEALLRQRCRYVRRCKILYETENTVLLPLFAISQ